MVHKSKLFFDSITLQKKSTNSHFSNSAVLYEFKNVKSDIPFTSTRDCRKHSTVTITAKSAVTTVFIAFL